MPNSGEQGRVSSVSPNMLALLARPTEPVSGKCCQSIQNEIAAFESGEFLALGREALQPHGDEQKFVFACAPWMLARLMRPVEPAGGSGSRGGGGAAGGSGGGATAKGSEVNADGGERCAMSGCSQAASSCLSWSGVSCRPSATTTSCARAACPSCQVRMAHQPLHRSWWASPAESLLYSRPSRSARLFNTLARGMTSVHLIAFVAVSPYR